MATVRSNLVDQVEAIRSRDDLVAFVRELLRDLSTNPRGWENNTLETYLEALAAWTNDLEGFYRNRGEPVPETPSWKLFGEVLLAASLYE